MAKRDKHFLTSVCFDPAYGGNKLMLKLRPEQVRTKIANDLILVYMNSSKIILVCLPNKGAKRFNFHITTTSQITHCSTSCQIKGL